jgi:exonuclease VII small subunit
MLISQKMIARGTCLLLLGLGSLPVFAQQTSDTAQADRRGPEQFMERMDANHDGKISADEFRGPKEIFEQLDTNKDGSLSTAEFIAARDQMRSRGRDNGPGGGRFQEMMLARLKERLGSTDEEWQVLEPQLKKILELQAKTRMMGFGGFGGFGRRGGQNQGPDGGGPGGPGGPGMGGPGGQSSAMPETDALRKAVDDTNTSDDALASALKAYRDAREKNDTELKAAREELRKVVTTKQEASLVLSGILD